MRSAQSSSYVAGRRPPDPWLSVSTIRNSRQRLLWLPPGRRGVGTPSWCCCMHGHRRCGPKAEARSAGRNLPRRASAPAGTCSRRSRPPSRSTNQTSSCGLGWGTAPRPLSWSPPQQALSLSSSARAASEPCGASSWVPPRMRSSTTRTARCLCTAEAPGPGHLAALRAAARSRGSRPDSLRSLP